MDLVVGTAAQAHEVQKYPARLMHWIVGTVDLEGTISPAPSWVRPLQGFLLGFLPALGWLVLQGLAGQGVAEVLRQDFGLLAYLWIAGTLVLVCFGALVARRERRWSEERQRWSELALTDPMTGLRNRRYFQARFEEALRTARREREPLSIAIIDVDRFKAVNDRHGHLVGDQVLRAVAAALKSVVRRGETLARVGGEEFAILLPGSDEAGAEAVAERVRRAVETARVRVPAVPEPLSVTASVGVASTSLLPEGAGRAVLYGAADAALRAAKEHGRNRVEVTGPLPVVRVCA